MKRHPVDNLLQIAFLEGAIGTHGAYETAVRRRVPDPDGPGSHDPALEDRLVAAARALVPSSRLTIGSYLNAVRRDPSESEARRFGERLGITTAMVRLLERDRLSPLRLPASVWRILGRTFGLGLPELREMIRRTHQVVVFGPAVRGTLARRRKGKQDRRANRNALEAVAREMLARADLRLPAGEESRLRSLLEDLDGLLP